MAQNDRMSIVEFLEARITEDELDAQVDAAEMGRSSVSIQFDCATQARFTPTRVLAECKAKRAVIERQFIDLSDEDAEYGCGHEPEEIRAGMCPKMDLTKPYTGPIIAVLAAVYSDHPDYRQEWAGPGRE